MQAASSARVPLESSGSRGRRQFAAANPTSRRVTARPSFSKRRNTHRSEVVADEDWNRQRPNAGGKRTAREASQKNPSPTHGAIPPRRRARTGPTARTNSTSACGFGQFGTGRRPGSGSMNGRASANGICTTMSNEDVPPPASNSGGGPTAGRPRCQPEPGRNQVPIQTAPIATYSGDVLGFSCNAPLSAALCKPAVRTSSHRSD
jgi:hypothetical protein